MTLIANLLSVALATVSGYALVHSAHSIPKLRKYEEKAEKAAEWSNVAEKRLWDTRYTVAAGFVMTIISLITAIYFLLFVPAGFGIRRIVWAVAVAAGEHFSSQYMHSFWNDKGKIPLMDDYNAAIEDTVNVIGLSDLLAFGWGLMGALKLFGL
ncbi:hypothetical protein GQ53DRAFT_802669 [Thozetella sp. PMI_491]|nr:hypothetical protein GQ53DRAFT_802669 [Thozetella sp. PMI_491]